MNYFNRIWLFLRIVYRIGPAGRMHPSDAWAVAEVVWKEGTL